jgi:hypothetical protein
MDYEIKKDDLCLLMEAKHVGKNNAVSMGTLSHQLGITERRLRELINEIRQETNRFGEYVLVSNYKIGYWLSDSPEDIKEWLKGYLGLAKTMFKTANAAKKHLKSKELDSFNNILKAIEDASESIVS